MLGLYLVVWTLSLLPPLAIFINRDRIRRIRVGLIEELEKVFNYSVEGALVSVPSFELIKCKYRSENTAPDPAVLRRFFAWTTAIVLFIFISWIGFYTCLVGQQPQMIHGGLFNVADVSLPALTTADASLISFSFLGGYLWSIQYLLRRVGTFDLSPLSLLRSSVHIVFGIAVVLAIFRSIQNMESFCETGRTGTLPLGVAFLIGIYPKVGLDLLKSRFNQFQLRRVGPATRELCEEVPLDVIHGIDPFIKFRLAEHEIEDCQNLATTNPIQLFVETPYGLYETFDWVAQAQLILAVGPQKALKLRQFSIRTVFDLERSASNPYLSGAIARIVIPEITEKEISAIQVAVSEWSSSNTGNQRVGPRDSPDVHLSSDNPFDAYVMIIRDDLHVKRLRQLWDIVRVAVDSRASINPAKSTTGR